jgi:hypothetical protein
MKAKIYYSNMKKVIVFLLFCAAVKYFPSMSDELFYNDYSTLSSVHRYFLN